MEDGKVVFEIFVDNNTTSFLFRGVTYEEVDCIDGTCLYVKSSG